MLKNNLKLINLLKNNLFVNYRLLYKNIIYNYYILNNYYIINNILYNNLNNKYYLTNIIMKNIILKNFYKNFLNLNVIKYIYLNDKFDLFFYYNNLLMKKNINFIYINTIYYNEKYKYLMNFFNFIGLNKFKLLFNRLYFIKYLNLSFRNLNKNIIFFFNKNEEFISNKILYFL
jgi:hypothetical protein